MRRPLYTVRAATGGFVVQVVDRVEEEEKDEVVFTDLPSLLGYLSDVLGADEVDPTAAYWARVDPGGPRP